jgi:hypothetical protein
MLVTFIVDVEVIVTLVAAVVADALVGAGVGAADALVGAGVGAAVAVSLHIGLTPAMLPPTV